VASIIADLPGDLDPAAVDYAELDGNLPWSPVPVREFKDFPAGIVSDPYDSLYSKEDPGLPDLLDRHTLEIHVGEIRQLWLLNRSGSGFSARLMMNIP
jgi:hypothetical protein